MHNLCLYILNLGFYSSANILQLGIEKVLSTRKGIENVTNS